MKIKIFTYLKSTDLHCMSAYDAITMLLDYKKLKRIRRFIYWELALNANTVQEAEQLVKKINQSSYYILNPNKEAYHISKLPKPKIESQYQVVLVKVDTPYSLNEDRLIKKISQKVGITIKSVTRSLLWELVINDKQPLATLQKELAERVITTSNRKQGLLVNLINESYRFIDPAIYYE